MEKLNPDFLRSVGFIKTKHEPAIQKEAFALSLGETRMYVEIFAKKYFYIRVSRNDSRFDYHDKEVTQDKFCELIKLLFDLDLKN